MITFKDFNLHSTIYQAIHACGYTDPTPVQAKSIPEILLGKDVAVSAQTGTGKTAAFILPILHRLSSQDQAMAPSVLILTPTRELANQINKAIETYGKYLRLRTASIVGGMPYPPQIKKLKQGTDLIVATPGRLIDHIEQQRIDLSKINVLVLDEADRMLDMGFIDDVRYIANLTPSSRQTLLFSATLDNHLINAVKTLLNKPLRIDLSNERIAAPQIKQEMYKAHNLQHKSRLLKHFLNDQTIYKAIIFSATKRNVEKLANQLCDEGFSAGALHGDLRQNARTRTLEQLRRGKIQFLVATDVAARGIDVSDITHVINFDLPGCEDYVHRIGRTGRAGKTGVAISFVLPTETKHLRSIERYIGQRIQLSEAYHPMPLEAVRPVERKAEPLERKVRSKNDFSQDRNEGRAKFKHSFRRDDAKDKDHTSKNSFYPKKQDGKTRQAKFKHDLPHNTHERRAKFTEDFQRKENSQRDAPERRAKFKKDFQRKEDFQRDPGKRRAPFKEDFQRDAPERRAKFKKDFQRKEDFQHKDFQRKDFQRKEDSQRDPRKRRAPFKEDFQRHSPEPRAKFKEDSQRKEDQRDASARKPKPKGDFHHKKPFFAKKPAKSKP